MGVKSNFSQAVSELIGISDHHAADEKKEEREEETKDMNPDPKERIKAILASRVQNQAAPSASEAPQSQETQSQETQSQETQSQKPQQPQASFEQTNSEEPSLQPEPDHLPGITTIMKGSVIIGEIHGEGDMELQGSVKGKITAKGRIRAMGKVVGDLTGRDIELTDCAIQGNIVASGMLTIDSNSVVIGDVACEEFCLDGKIKGNVTVEKEAKFQPMAILSGNVKAASIAMSQGAKIKGEINIPLSEKDTELPFDIEISIE